jgi:hypothetical protein
MLEKLQKAFFKYSFNHVYDDIVFVIDGYKLIRI